MKIILCITLIAVVAGFGSASPTGENTNAEMLDNYEQESFPMVQLHGDLNRYRKSYGSKGGSTISAHPCPKNYLFSCAPNLSPVPCSSGGGYGSSGAYTAPVPLYLAPMGNAFKGHSSQFYQN